jgi:hypothetical protein
MRRDVKVKDIHRHPHRRARIRDIDHAREMPLHRRAREQQVDLIVIVSCPTSVTVPTAHTQVSTYRIVSDTQ